MFVRRVYTFGHGQPNFPGYVVVYGSHGAHCREQMIAAYGQAWSFEYTDEESAGVDRFRLPLIRVINDPKAGGLP